MTQGTTIEPKDLIQGGNRERQSGLVSKEKTRLVAALLGFRIALDISLYWFVAPMFHNHFLFRIGFNFDFVHYVSSLLIYSLAVVFTGAKKNSINDLFLLVAVFFCLAPITAVYGVDATREAYPVLLTLGSIFLVHTVGRIKFGVNIKTISKRGGERLAITWSVVSVLFFIAYTVGSGATRYINFDFLAIYDFRPMASKVLDVGVIAYFNVWVTKVFNIFLFSVAIHKRWKVVAAVCLVIQIYFATITSFRGLLFLPILSLGLLLFYQTKIEFYKLINIASGLFVFVLIISKVFDMDVLGALIIRRAFFVPASATFEWFAYFYEHNHVYWADNILSFLIKNEYTGQSIPFIIGDHLAFGLDVGANNGMVSSGYAHAGALGVALYSVLFGLVLRSLNYIAKSGVPLWIIAAIMINPVRTVWNASDLFTTLLSHGIIVGIVLLSVFGGKARAVSGWVNPESVKKLQ